jgi:hypothetical protein
MCIFMCLGELKPGCHHIGTTYELRGPLFLVVRRECPVPILNIIMDPGN